LEGCSEEIGDLCCIAFKPVKKDGAMILDTTVSRGQETVWVSEDTMAIPTLVTDLFETRYEVRWFLSPATDVSGVVWETEVGIPTLRGLGMEPSQKVSLPVMDLNGLKILSYYYWYFLLFGCRLGTISEFIVVRYLCYKSVNFMYYSTKMTYILLI
jgi:hypothetical protein